MEWIVTTARSVEEAQTRALDLLGVDLDDAEIQVIEEGKTGLFGRTKSEARVRARIKPKAPAVKEERRGGGGRNDNRNRNRNNNNRNRNRGGGGGGDNRNRNQSKGGGNKGGGQGSSQGGGQAASQGGQKRDQGDGGGSNNKNDDQGGGNRNNRNRNRNRNRSRGGGGDRQHPGGEDRVEMPVDEQRETLEAFVQGVATVFDSTATVTLVEEDTTLIAQVEGEDLGRLIGPKASTLQTLEELARTAMHRAAAGRRYHRIQVDVDSYRARRREALSRFATQVAQSVVDSGESKALEPMGAADRKLVHDAVSEVSGVETVSEGRDPRRYIVIHPLAGADEEE